MWARGLDDRAGDAHVRAAGRHALAGRDAAASGRDAARVHRAEPAVPDGQPGRVRPGRRCGSSRSDGARSASRVHHTGTDAELDAFVKDVEKIVRQEGAIFGEYPDYEPGTYTFLADYLPYANGDGMEHRNSTVITSPASIAGGRDGSARHGRARVLPRLERRAHPPEVARAVRFRAREHVRRAVARRGLHAVLRPAGRCSAPASPISARPPRTLTGLVEAVTNDPGRRGAIGRGDEPDGAVHRRRPDGGSHELVRTPSSRITRSAGRSRWRST